MQRMTKVVRQAGSKVPTRVTTRQPLCAGSGSWATDALLGECNVGLKGYGRRRAQLVQEPSWFGEDLAR